MGSRTPNTMSGFPAMTLLVYRGPSLIWPSQPPLKTPSSHVYLQGREVHLTELWRLDHRPKAISRRPLTCDREGPSTISTLLAVTAVSPWPAWCQHLHHPPTFPKLSLTSFLHSLSTVRRSCSDWDPHLVFGRLRPSETTGIFHL